MNPAEVILEIGAEGGSLTLYGVRTPSGWLFSRDVIDQTLQMLDEESIEHSSETVDSWSAALELLSEYPWVNLFPLQVHPEFRGLVIDAVRADYKTRNDTRMRQRDRWERLCGVGEADRSGPAK